MAATTRQRLRRRWARENRKARVPRDLKQATRERDRAAVRNLTREPERELPLYRRLSSAWHFT